MSMCNDLIFTNFGDVGTCFIENVLFGDFTLAALIMFVLVTALIIRYNFPITMIIPVGTSLAYVLWLVSGADIFLGILMLGLIVSGGVLVLGVLNYVNKG